MQTDVVDNCFGGFLLKRANARAARPFTAGADLHVTLLAHPLWGARSFLYPKNMRELLVILRQQSRRSGVKLKWSRFESSRLHLRIRSPSRERLSAFLRAVTGLIARKILRAEKGRKARTEGRPSLWLNRPLTAWLKADHGEPGGWLAGVEGFVASSVGRAGTVGAAGLAPPGDAHSSFAFS